MTSETEEGGTGYELTTHGSGPLASYSNSLAATAPTVNGLGRSSAPYRARVAVGASAGGAAGDAHLARGSLDRVRGVTAEDMHLAVTPRAGSAAAEREQQAGHVSATVDAARSSSNDLQVGVGALYGRQGGRGTGGLGDDSPPVGRESSDGPRACVCTVEPRCAPRNLKVADVPYSWRTPAGGATDGWHGRRGGQRRPPPPPDPRVHGAGGLGGGMPAGRVFCAPRHPLTHGSMVHVG